MNIDDIPDGIIAVVVAALLGGYIGGLLVGVRANLIVSMLVGVIAGVSLATVLQSVGAEPILGANGYSMLYGFAGGVGTSWVVAKVS